MAQPQNTSDTSHTFTDLMTSLAVIFILLLVATMNNASADSERAVDDLKREVAEVLKDLNLTITEDPNDPFTQIINLDEEKVKFANGSSVLKQEGSDLIHDLFKKLTPKLCDNFLLSRLESVIIEGHTNNVGDVDTKGKLNNVHLSQDRAYAVMKEAFNEVDKLDGAQVDCLRNLASATGRGSNRPLLVSDPQSGANRRVEVKIRVRNNMRLSKQDLSGER